MFLIAALLVAEPIAPPRQTDLWISSQQSLIDLQTCVTREWVRFGRVTPLPLANGAALDFQMHQPLAMGGPGQPTLTIEFHDPGPERRITVAYRHPWSKRVAYGLFKDTGKRCFPQEWEAAALPRPGKNREGDTK